MAKLTVHRKAHKRKSYIKDVKPGPGKKMRRIEGTTVEATTFKVKDRGKRGRTPKSEQWYEPKTEMGWKKEQSATTRRRLALKAHGGDKLAAGRSLQALANVTTDNPTKIKAQADAKYFFAKHNKEK